MADRLTDLVLGLQRLAENAKLRGDDLRYTQQQEAFELDEYLGQLLAMTEKLHTTLLEERRKLRAPQQLLQQEAPVEKMPRIVKQGPLDDKRAG
jgi:hypothetical protein